MKLKSFALMLVEEHQLHTEQMDQQKQKIQDLSQKLQEREQSLAAASAGAQEHSQNLLRLETQLELRAASSAQEHQEMSSKLAQEEAQSRQLRLKLKGASCKLQELEERNRRLQQSEEELQELRQKMSKGECGSSTLMAELENLRKKVLEMEGKDEEITKMENQCRELGKKLQEEENHGKELRMEVDKLQRRKVELEKLEGWFGQSKSESLQLQTQLEKEKQAVKDLGGELEKLKKQMKEVRSSESKMEQAESSLKEDLKKLKSFTVLLMDERKNMEERLRQEEQRSQKLAEMYKEEQGKVTEVTEKLIEESKKLLGFKKEMEEKVAELSKEREELKTKLREEEEESEEKQEKKVRELTLEVERLKKRLEHLEVLEGDLLKTEDQYDLLQKKFRTEQDKANALEQILEESRSRALQGDVQALKEKIHQLMNKEDQLSQLQVDFSVLQQSFLKEEQRSAALSHHIDRLKVELEASKRYTRSLRPSGSRMSNVLLTSTAVQTDATAAEDDTAAGFIRNSVLEENHLMSNLREQQHLNMSSVLDRFPLSPAEVRTDRSWIPYARRKDAVTLTQTSHLSSRGTSLLRPPDANVFPKQGRPLRIRVTPDSGKTTATLEIRGRRAEDFFSSTTIIPTLGYHKPRITIVPKPTGGAAVGGPDPAPVTITTISRSESSSDNLPSPVSIITVSTTPVAEACPSPEARPLVHVLPEQQPGQARRPSSSIVTTEDNKIHIHLGPQPKQATEGRSSPLVVGPSSKDAPTGTVLRQMHRPAAGKMPQMAPGKMTSSITITPVTSTPSRPTREAVSPPHPP